MVPAAGTRPSRCHHARWARASAVFFGPPVPLTTVHTTLHTHDALKYNSSWVSERQRVAGLTCSPTGYRQSAASASTTSGINASLDGVLRRFAEWPLDEAYPYPVLDARYEKVRFDGVTQTKAVLVGIGISWDGKCWVRGVERSNREARSTWWVEDHPSEHGLPQGAEEGDAADRSLNQRHDPSHYRVSPQLVVHNPTYLATHGIGHTRDAPYHPMTRRKLDRHRPPLKNIAGSAAWSGRIGRRGRLGGSKTIPQNMDFLKEQKRGTLQTAA